MSSPRPVAAENETRAVARDVMEDSSSEHDSADEYDILYPDPRGRDIMDNSAFLADWIPDVPMDTTLAFTSSLPVQVTVQVASSLVRRVTYCRFNWKTETLRSFLEVLCWTSVTGVAYSLHRDWLWAAQIGFLFGLVMSLCDEVCITGARLLLHRIVAHPDARSLLQRAGFDVATHKRPSGIGSDEAVAIKNVVFGAMALETVHQLYLSTSENIQSFAILSATMGVAFVLMGEVFCLWLPTRRLGLTVQARWTRIPKNWQVHFQRSLLEITCWVACLSYVYSTTASLYSTIGWSSLLGSALCIIGGLDPLEHDANESEDDELSSYWSAWGASNVFVDSANAIVRLQASLQQAHS